MSHRFIKFYLGAMLWLSAAPAFGQTPFFPFDLPARSVIANPLGGSAPASAMSFDQLRSTLMLPPDGPVQIVPNGTIWGNISGGMGLASFYGISPVLDSLLGTTQGSVVYRNATGWVSLPPGVLGQLLSTGGGGANPSWITANGTGTVTSVTCGAGLTGGTFSTIGTCAVQSNILNNVLLNTLTASNSATLSDTTSLTSTYSVYEIVFENIIPRLLDRLSNCKCTVEDRFR
jgi:hypothetical protein